MICFFFLFSFLKCAITLTSVQGTVTLFLNNKLGSFKFLTLLLLNRELRLSCVGNGSGLNWNDSKNQRRKVVNFLLLGTVIVFPLMRDIVGVI